MSGGEIPLVADSSGSAVDTINTHLNIGAAIVNKGDELKCWIPGEAPSPVDKAYLTADDCRVLSRAFAALAAEFTSHEVKK